ncbi:MAG TPA: ABC transporter permease [Anaerolineae bacterium]|nr:ABC transporter permease [Anaerolineae bacterium]
MFSSKKKNTTAQNILVYFSKWEIQLVIIILIVIVIGSILSPHFLNLKNQLRNTKNFMEVSLMALPMAFIIITGGIDLSVANNLLMSAVVMAVLFERGVPIWIAVLIGIVAGTLGGLLNGILVGVVKLPSLVATLGTYSLFRGIAYTLLREFTVKGFPDSFNSIGQKTFPGTIIPNPLVIFAFFTVIFTLLLHYTYLGRYLYVMGQNEDACRYSGVPVDKVKIFIFAITGFMSAIAGMIMASRYGSVDADIASGYELSVITAVVLGGVMTTGGAGTMPGVILSLFLLGFVRLLMNLLNVRGPIQKIAFGALLVAAILLPKLVDIIRRKRRKKAVEKNLQKV